MIETPDYRALLATAVAEARQGLAEGGIPIGAALYHQDGRLLGCGHNRRVQEGDPSVFNIGTVVVGESVNFDGGLDWLREAGVNVIDLQDAECIEMLGSWIAANPETWNEDIGED